MNLELEKETAAIELIDLVIDKLTQMPSAYDQSNTIAGDRFSECGSAGCIGGWAEVLATNKTLKLHDDADWPTLFNLREEEHPFLFAEYPEDVWPEPYRAQWQATLDVPFVIEQRTAQSKIAIAYLSQIRAEKVANCERLKS